MRSALPLRRCAATLTLLLAWSSAVNGQDDLVMDLLDIQCSADDMEACNALGIAFEGMGNPARATEFFTKACSGGEAVACSNLGEFYYDGRGVAMDRQKALELFWRACAEHVQSGCAGVCVVSSQVLAEEQRQVCRAVLAASCQGGKRWMCSHLEGWPPPAGTAPPAGQEPTATSGNGCQTGGPFIAEAYVRTNPIYALYFRDFDLKAYVAANRSHFAPGGDAIRCASALSQALVQTAIQIYDPEALRRRQELLDSLGIPHGPAEADPATELMTMGRRLARLARVLPPAAAGNYGPLETPTNEIEQAELIGAQVLTELLRIQDPAMIFAVQQMEPMIRELTTLERQIVANLAASLAAQ